MRDAKLAALDRGPRDRDEIRVSRPDDVAAVGRLVADVRAWLAAGAADGGSTMVLEPGNSFQRAVQYQELRRDQFGAGAAAPGFYVEVRWCGGMAN